MFNQESTLVTILNKAADMVILSVLWCICSLPVLTIGAASAALYHTSIRVLRQNRGYAFATFRDSFKENLRQTLPFTALLLFLYALFGVTGYVCWQRPDSMIAGMYVFFSLFSILVCLTVQIHGFALMGRFRLRRGTRRVGRSFRCGRAGTAGSGRSSGGRLRTAWSRSLRRGRSHRRC